MLKIQLVTFFLIISFLTQSQNINDKNLELLKNLVLNDETSKAKDYILYDSTIVDVQETGLTYVVKHQLTKILSDQSALEFRQVAFDYEPLSAYVKVLSAKIYRKDGSIEVLDSNDFIDIAAPARMIYWGARKLIINFGRLEKGDAIETKIFRKGFTYALLTSPEDDERFIPPMRGHFYDIIEFWSSTYIKEKVYELLLPPTKTIQYEFFNGEVEHFVHFPTDKHKEKVTTNPFTKTNGFASKASLKNYIQKDNKNIYLWKMDDITPFKAESNMTAYSDVAPKLLISTSKDWYAKSKWFYKVNEDYGSFESTPEIKKKVDELLKGVTDEMEKISLLTHWCAENIRYSGISMGKGEGYTLHKGDMTFKDRCGVCKDKAGMLITMLRAAGFESYAAMTQAGSNIERIPADQFNHSITVVKLSDGTWSLLDPTWVPGVRELWSSAEQQQGFLMGLPEGADLMYTPVSPAENHFWKMDVKSILTEKGTLTANIIITAEGQSDANVRRGLKGYVSFREEYFPSLIAESYPQAIIKSVAYPDIEDISKPIEVKLSIEIPDFALINGNKMTIVPFAAFNPFNDYYNAPEYYVNTNIEERKYGFKIGFSRQIEIHETMLIPDGFKISGTPETFEQKDAASSLKIAYSNEAKQLDFVLKHIMNKRLYDKEDWNIFRSNLIKRQSVGNSPVTIQKMED